jgi:hypothetical protein
MKKPLKSAGPKSAGLAPSSPGHLGPLADLCLVEHASVCCGVVTPHRPVEGELAKPPHAYAKDLGGVAGADQLAVGR